MIKSSSGNSIQEINLSEQLLNKLHDDKNENNNYSHLIKILIITTTVAFLLGYIIFIIISYW